MKLWGADSLRVAICTGIAGSHRRQCLGEVATYANQRNKELKIIDVFDVLRRVSKAPVDEATILQIPPEARQQLTVSTYREIARILRQLRAERQADDNFAVAIVARATFQVPGQILKEVPRAVVSTLHPDLFISIVHNLRELKRNLENDSFGRFRNITLLEILSWRRDEIEETKKWGKPNDNYIVARNEPASTIFNLIFSPQAKKIYASFPISHSHRNDVERARKLIEKLRSRNYTVFNPLAINDEEYIMELINQRNIGKGILSNYSQEEIDRIRDEVGAQTVLRDYALIAQSNGVIVRYTAQKYLRYEETGKIVPDIHIPLSAGVVCEMVYGKTCAKRVYAVWLIKDVLPSPFFTYHCTRVFQSERELLNHLARARW